MKRYEDFLFMLEENGVTLKEDTSYAIDKFKEFLEDDGSRVVKSKEQKPNRFFKVETNNVKLKIGVTLILKSFFEGQHYYWCQVLKN